ncbi:MAG TPA: hypothetical protein PLV87_12570, partial [Opitutaceae bacterium]|nr:hypothetical protein [Opitutaceae bacterium]
TGDSRLAHRAWSEFARDPGGRRFTADAVRMIRGPEVLRPVEELPGVSTNDTAQWGLAAIECLALLGAPPAE